MKNSSRWYRKAVTGLALMAGLVFVSTPALAQFLGQGTVTSGGISANTDITNSATLNYAITGTTQPLITSAPTTFKVDNLVRVVVTEVGGAFTAVAPNATGQVTTFTVTNTGNTTMDFALAANGSIADAQTVVLSGTTYADSSAVGGAGFNVACQVFVESGGAAGYGAGDTAQVISSLSPVAGSNSITVYSVCTIPGSPPAINGNSALVSVTATASNVGTCATGCVTTLESTPTNGLNVVFADAAGSDDIVRDGKHSARDVYQVAAAIISVSKTVSVICDPFNGSTGPRNIPGAYVRYEITITNATGAASATLTDISDALNANTTFDPDQRLGTGGSGANLCTNSTVASAIGSGFRLICTGTTRASVVGTCASAGGQFFTTANDGDAMFFTPSTVTARFGTGGGSVTGAQALPAEVGPGYAAGELKGGESVTIRFNAIIN